MSPSKESTHPTASAEPAEGSATGSAQEAADEQRRAAHVRALLTTLSDTARETVIVVDAAGAAQVLGGGGVLAQLLGEPPQALVAALVQRSGDLLRPHQLPDLRARYQAVQARPGGVDRFTLTLHLPDGSMRSLRATMVNELHQPHIAALVVKLVVDGPEPVVREDALEVTLDPVPGGQLPDRAAFLATLDRAVQRKEQRDARGISDDRYAYSLILLELDRFKMLLGGFGRDILETLVEQVIKRISAMLRGDDAVAYLGGGELGLLLHRVGTAEQATLVADAVMTVLEERFDVGGHIISVAPVVGIATSERRYRNADELVRDASAAVSRAHRRRGRRRQAFQTNIRIEDTERIRMMAAMQTSVGTPAFWLAYQPIVRLADEAIIGFEALCRWNHPQLGAIAPDRFIPLAEETGLIRVIGGRVLEQACYDMAQWNLSLVAGEPLTISVNVSALQLLDDGLIGQVDQVLDKTGLRPQQLRLEITESAVLDNLEAVSAVIARLKERGVTFSLDDFGTGYSSLSYLRLLPYDSLKIDRSFLSPRQTSPDTAEQETPANGGDVAIVSTVVSLARNLGLEVVAEGVESPGQVQMLRQLGCDYAQGFHFSRPLDRAAAAMLIHQRRAQ